MTIQPTTTVGQLVVEQPSRSRIFESLGIDYCCGGKVSLEAACRKKGLAVDEIIAQLEGRACAGAPSPEGAPADPASMTLSDLADHIEQAHHRYLRRELPRLEQLTEKVAAAHGDRDPRLHRVHEIFGGFNREMAAHMRKEEQILFPMIRAAEAGTRMEGLLCASMAGPIRQMEAEHEQSGDALAELRELTDGFAPPPDACGSYRAMLDGLAELERDTHQHVHKENNILFPGAARLERSAAGARR